jgi:pyruvate/2-oxoglutarate dehydrogenase complex dihydrolipoamide dehydrogenase (E3) component
VIERADRLIPREDPETSAELAAILAGEGIEILCSAAAVAVTGRADDLQVEVTASGASRTIAGSHLLVAIGRAPPHRGATAGRWRPTRRRP